MVRRRLRLVDTPPGGVWRIGRGGDALEFPERSAVDLGDSRAGNRFDSFTGQFSVLYFGTDLEACFGETLSRYRPDPRLASIADEWRSREDFMGLGAIPADWRTRRTAVRVDFDSPFPFLDVEDAGTRAVLERELAPTLSMIGVKDLDVAVMRGHDRRITRFISQWAWQQVDANNVPMFAGIRYLSRTSSHWECWAVFDDINVVEVERRPILPTDPALRSVAELYDLVVH